MEREVPYLDLTRLPGVLDLMMSDQKQKDKTKEYWDTFYSELPSADDVNRFASEGNLPANTSHAKVNDESSDLEWILPTTPNSHEILDTILSMFPSSDQSVGDDDRANVLEIGCGVSQLSLSSLQRILLKNKEMAHTRAYDFVSTDVSPVCIERNQMRDDAFISSLDVAEGSLSYELLDVLDESSTSHTQKYDVILDKGTLDTFLFRSKRTKKSSAFHPPLLTPLLNNIHRWLVMGQAKYIIISPRAKIKSIRDFQGFDSVRRIRVDTTALDGGAVLVKGANSAQSKSVYLYVCTKNDTYNPEKDEPYCSLGYNADDASTCVKCGMSFKEFRGKVDVKDQGKCHIRHF